MLKACIEIISTGEIIWTDIPNENLAEEIPNFTGDNDWEVVITCLEEDKITTFVNNCFHKCDIFDLNDLLLSQTNKPTIEYYAILNLLLEDRNCNVSEVKNLLESGEFIVYRNVDNMGDVAREYLENCSTWYSEAKESQCCFDEYFDFKSYGEEILCSNGNWLQDKNYKIIIEVFD